jgi:hypothetical protein
VNEPKREIKISDLKLEIFRNSNKEEDEKEGE